MEGNMAIFSPIFRTSLVALGLAQGPRVALGMMKRNLNAAGEGMLADLLDLEAAQQIAAGRTRDHREAAQAFVEKRKPRFIGE